MILVDNATELSFTHIGIKVKRFREIGVNE